MKFTKLSLIAALAVSAAVAGGDIEPAPVPAPEVSPWTFGGSAKLYYSSTDGDGVDLFSKESAIGQAAVAANVSYAFADTWKANVGITGLATLGLDDSVVSGVWLYAGANATDGALPLTSVGDALWFDTANITGTAFDGKATFILGRTELDTPLAFSETWSIAPNTFDAAVAMGTFGGFTAVAGYIYDGNGNGARIGTFETPAGGFTGDNGYFPIAGVEEGAWTVAGIYKWEELTAQAWYYDVIDIAQAVWVQADYGYEGFTIGGQYAYIDPSDLGNALGVDLGNNESTAFAGKIGYTYNAFEAWAAYSSVDDDGIVSVSNTATMLSGAGWGGASGYPSGQSKLYTEAWWNYGYVGLPGADTFALAASYNVGDHSIFNGIKLLGQYTSVTDAKNTMVAALDPYDPTTGEGTPIGTWDMDEFTALVGATIYGLEVNLAYIWADYTVNSEDAAYAAAGTYDNNTVQAYLTYTF